MENQIPGDLVDLEKNPFALAYDSSEYDLEGYRQVLELIGAPQADQYFIHIAGTKGKGSIAAIIESILLSHGVHTAMYSSPHLQHYGERFRYDGLAWSEQEFKTASQRLINRYGPRAYRTTFEFLTSLALTEFRERAKKLLKSNRVSSPRQVICWETGLGGRLDCTNVVNPVATVISAIGIDHSQILGTTIEEITTEKCGIIKPTVPVILARQDSNSFPTVYRIVKECADKVSSPLFCAWEVSPVLARSSNQSGQDVTVRLPSGDIIRGVLPLHGEFQTSNLEAAIAAIWYARNRLQLSIDPNQVSIGISNVVWPGRLEILKGNAGTRLALDCAHCPLSAAAIGIALKSDHLLTEPIHLIWAMQRDKDHDDFLKQLIAHAQPGMIQCVHTFLADPARGTDPILLKEIAIGNTLQANAYATCEGAMCAAIDSNKDLLAIGSLRTITPVRKAWEKNQANI